VERSVLLGTLYPDVEFTLIATQRHSQLRLHNVDSSIGHYAQCAFGVQSRRISAAIESQLRLGLVLFERPLQIRENGAAKVWNGSNPGLANLELQSFAAPWTT
jgi:hypothetical protein